MRRKLVKVYMQVADYQPVFLEKVAETEAEAYINLCEKKDRYEHEVEGYGFPYGYPKYFVAK